MAIGNLKYILYKIETGRYNFQNYTQSRDIIHAT